METISLFWRENPKILQESVACALSVIELRFLEGRYFISPWMWSCGAFTCEIRRQDTAGSESQTVGSSSKIGIFPPPNKRRPLPSAERFAFLFLHQEISDKRIHYQGFHPDQT